MIPALIHTALRFRLTVVVTAILIVGLGIWSFLHQQIDAYPDISAQMVQVITTYPGRAPEEVERQVTIPIEIAMRNVPRVETIRSRTIFGLSVVQLMFEEGTRAIGRVSGCRKNSPACNYRRAPLRTLALWRPRTARSCGMNWYQTARRT